MSASLSPVPDVFAKVASDKILSEIVASPALKVALQSVFVLQHQKSSCQRDFVRSVGAVLHKQQWEWPRGHKILTERFGDDPLMEDLLDALYKWFTTATYQLYRRAQLRALLSNGAKYSVRISADPEANECAPCGAVDGAIQPLTQDLLRRMPPCSHPFCCCRWEALRTL